MRKKVVIAGNYDEFLYWCRENYIFPNQAIYADSDEKLRGLELSQEDIIYTGQHWNSKIDRVILKSRIRERSR
jgi:hypothetical protein